MAQKDKYFVFSVPTAYIYEIQAESEKEAREILVEHGGIEIYGDQCEMLAEDYQNAELEQTYEM
ncbi:MAG: hypothetical protein MUQ75_01695 [Crocinitomicaceae bacterium]|jgi:hypothetical protein|nr:hypothetical protein [Crocinitomicaceae bacterium]